MKIKKRIIYLTLALAICLASNNYCSAKDEEYDMGAPRIYTDSEGNTCELWITDAGALTYVMEIKEDTVLKELIIPDDVTKIDWQGIAYARIEKIYLHAGIKDIMTLSHNAAEEFIVDENNPAYCSKDGVVYSKDMKVLVGYPNYKEEQIFKIPDTVEKIEWRFVLFRADGYSKSIPENIILPSSLKDFDRVSLPFNIDFYIPPEINDISEDNWNEYLEYYIQNMCDIRPRFVSAYNEPKIVFTEADSPYMEMFNSNEMWLPVTGEKNYNMRHVIMALKMSLGLYNTHMDLWEYANNGNSKVLFDENGNEKVDLDDVKVVLRKALKIE